MTNRSPVVTALGRPPFVAALGALTLLLVVWAAAVPRPERVIPSLREGLEVKEQAPPEGFGGYEPDVLVERDPTGFASTSDTIAFVLGWVMITVLVLAAGFCLFVIVRAWLAGHERRTPPVSSAADLDLDALAVAVTTDSSTRLDALSAGTPAQGIVAAWSHLEATLHEAGVRLPPSRTSSEVALDTLRRFPVDPETLQSLAALYREARWSHHPLTEDDRARAATAYRALDADLRAGMPETRPGRRG